MRVQSSRPAKNGGWLHPVGESVKPFAFTQPKDERPKINATAMIREWRAKTPDEAIARCASKLGVHFQALALIGTAWAEPHKAWAFAMKDGYGNIIGIRLRDDNGRKWAVTGSRAGLFFGAVQPREVCVCEGPTDTAAALTLGLNAVGRPSCLGSEDMLLTALKPCDRVLIIADNDDPGWQGAQRFQERLKVPSLCWSPPAKDLREFLRLGGTRELIHSLVGSLIWRPGRK